MKRNLYSTESRDRERDREREREIGNYIIREQSKHTKTKSFFEQKNKFGLQHDWGQPNVRLSSSNKMRQMKDFFWGFNLCYKF